MHAPPKYTPQETQPKMPKFSTQNDGKFHPTANDVKFLSNHQQQNNRLMPPTDNRMMQTGPPRMMTQDNSRILPNDSSRILNDNHLLTDHRALLNDTTRLHLVTEAPRLLVNDNTRLLTANDNRLITNDNARLLSNMNDNNRLLPNDNSRILSNDNARHLAVIESSRILADKYLSNYDPYHRGHL